MTRKRIFRSFALTAALFFIVAAFQTKVNASGITFDGSSLEGDYLTRDGAIYIPIEDIADPMDLSVLFDGSRLMIGGTINGTVVIEPESNLMSINGQQRNPAYRIINESGKWYVPGEFLYDIIGVQVILNDESDIVDMFPLVTSITASPGKLEIKSSIPCAFTSFELDSPERRVVDINNAYLSGLYTQVDGAEIGLERVREVRASQFSVDPPTVRVVLEWVDSTPPAHTILPDGNVLSIRFGGRIRGESGMLTGNIITPAVDDSTIVEDVQVPETGNVAGVSETTSVIQFPGTASVDQGDNHRDIFSFGQSDSSGQIPVQQTSSTNIPEIAETSGLTENLGPEIGRTQIPVPPTPPETENPLDGSEFQALSELGWDVTLEMDPKGDISANIKTPGYESVFDFILPGENPRLVLDITGAYISGNEKSIDGLGMVNSIRFAQFQPEISRVVFDLTRNTGYAIEKNQSDGSVQIQFRSGDLSGMVVVIDPGHGGEDPGAVQNGINEKDLNLEMVFMLRDFLGEKGASVILTRDKDDYVTLKERVDIARENTANLFICVHNNSSDNETAEQGLWLLYNNENNMRLYQDVHRGVAAKTGIPGRGPVADDRGLYILRHLTDIPVLYIEAAFLTNPDDVVRLTDLSRSYLQNIMAGVTDGILAYYAGLPLPEVNIPGFDSGIFALADSNLGSSWEVPSEINSSELTSASEASASTPGSEESSDDDTDDDDSDGNDNHRKRGRGGYRYR